MAALLGSKLASTDQTLLIKNLLIYICVFGFELPFISVLLYHHFSPFCMFLLLLHLFSLVYLHGASGMKAWGSGVNLQWEMLVMCPMYGVGVDFFVVFALLWILIPLFTAFRLVIVSHLLDQLHTYTQ